jgi:hypothetical protein
MAYAMVTETNRGLQGIAMARNAEYEKVTIIYSAKGVTPSKHYEIQ